MSKALTFEQAWRIRGAVGGIAALAQQTTVPGHQRSPLAVAARRAASESGVAFLADAITASTTTAPGLASAHVSPAELTAFPTQFPRA